MANKGGKSGSGWCQGLQKIGNVYHFRFMHKGKMQKGSTGTSVHQEAKEFLRRLRNMKAMEKVGIMSVPTLRALIAQWKTVRGPLVTEDHLKKADDFTKHVPNILDRPIDKIKNADIDEIKAAYMTIPRTTATGKIIPHGTGGLNEVLKILKAILNFGVEREYMEVLPCRIRKEKVKKVARPYVGDKQVTEFLKAVDAYGGKHQQMAIRLMLGLGLREKEARLARWEWINWNAGTYTPGLTKAGEATALRLPEWVSIYLKAAQPENQIQGLIIPNRKGKAYSKSITANVIRRAGRAVQIFGLTPHRMRSSFVTQLAQNGADLKSIQTLARHGDAATTALYMEYSEGAAMKAMKALDDKIMGRSPKPK